MAQEFKMVNASALPAATNITDNDMILIIQSSGLKRALPSAMKGKPGNPGASAYLGVSSTHIQWKQGPGGSWQNLLEIEKLRGPKGEKPIFRKVNGTLQMRYEGEPDTAFVNILDREELKMKFSDLTDAEVNQLKLHFSDLTDADKAELMKPATDAGAEVRDKMTAIEQSATEVITGAEAANNTANQVIANVNTANNQAVEAENARIASELLRIEEEKKRVTDELARVEADKLRKESEDARVEAEKLRLEKELERINAELARAEAEALRVQESKTAVDNAVAATQLATDAAGAAQEAAEKQPIFDVYGNVYFWDRTLKDYVKSDINLMGKPFTIATTYPSVEAMKADVNNDKIPPGAFVTVSVPLPDNPEGSNVEEPDTAKIYVKRINADGVAGFDFVVDMSGARGFAGKTPQIVIGTVTKGDDPVASLSPDGTDPAGNPKFKLNFVLPQGEKGDTPILTAGTVTTGEPGTPASAELVSDGATDAGIPRYRLDLTIPEGRQGAGNVSVPPAALKAGVTYLFKPSADGSAEGEFIEYVPAAQEQADWDVTNTALPSFIMNKPESLPANGGNADTIQDVPLNAISHYLISGETYPAANDMIAPGFGYGYSQAGWATYGPFIIFGMPSSSSYAMQIQGSYNDTGAFYRTKNDINNAWNPWHQLAIHGEPQPASDVHPWAKQPVKPSYSMDEITDSGIFGVDPDTITRKIIYGSVKNAQGYVTRIALGTKNDSNRFGPGVLSVGTTDDGTTYFDWYFDPYNARITTSGGDTVAFTSDTVEAANKLGNARAINGTYFDGTANVVTSYWGTARNISFVNDVAASFDIDGSQNLAPSIEVQRVTGTYSGNGGIQPPSFIPSGKVRFAMMNLTMNSNSSYKDFMLMDTYMGVDVPWVTGFAIEKSVTPRAWIITGAKGGDSWGYSAEIWTTQNFNPDSLQPKISYADLGNVDYLHSLTFRGDYKYYYLTLLNSSSFAALPDVTQSNGLEFTVIIFCAGMTTINLPTGSNYINMNGDVITVDRGNLNVEVNFLCIGNKWRSTFIIQSH